MAANKTQPTDASVQEFLDALPERRRQDAVVVAELLERVTGEEPVMWGSTMVGYGHRHLRYASGRELDWFDVGFSPRAQATTVYLSCDVNQYREILDRLGPHSTGKGCLYLKKVSEVDLDALTELVRTAMADPDRE